MFGLENLFSDGDESCQVVQQSTKSGIKAPPARRSKCGFVGISNQGATCYLNSLLQTLFFTSEFRDALFKLKEEELGSLSKHNNKDSPGVKVRVIPLQLQKLFARMLISDRQSVSTTDLTDSFGWTNNEELQQHDVQELNRILFSAVEDSLVGTSGRHIINRLYHGSIVNKITCSMCGYVSEREEEFLDLSVSVCGTESLEAGLASYYCETEQMAGKNQYRCSSCNKLVDASKLAKLRSLPDVLTISLLRFSFDLVKMQRFKETGKFVFPSILDMSPYQEKVDGSSNYELFSVVVHRGGAYGGHYTAYIRDVDSLGKWTPPEEDSISVKLDPGSGESDVIECESPVELLQTILNRAPSKCLTIDKLGGEISKITGVSWNKRFKRQYGPITKFVTKYDDKFDFDPSCNLVSLRQYGASTVVHDVHVYTDVNARDQNNGTNRRSASPPPLDGHCWFQFNDSQVYSVKEKEIQSTFSGKSSAYMLFYRKISHHAPKDGAISSIPEELVTEILLENSILEEERDLYDVEINRLNLQIHFAVWYKFCDGALQPYDVENSFLPLTIDRRKTVGELKIAIIEVGGELIQENFVVHEMRELPSGYHLYEQLPADDNILLQNISISDGALLFMWDGEMVEDRMVLTGVDCEPILLNISLTHEQSLVKGFPKNMLLSELCQIICDTFNLDCDQTVIKRVVGKDEVKMLPFTYDQFSESLGSLKLSDGAELLIDTQDSTRLQGAGDIEFVPKITVEVENRCQGEDGPRKTCKLQLLKTDTVSLIKSLAMTKFGLVNVHCGGRLRVDHDSLGLRSPLHEEQTLEDAAITKGTKLVLEPGIAPKSNQITLNISSNTEDPTIPDLLEIMVDRNDSVEECLTCVLNRLEITDCNWHLRKTNWCGESADILDDSYSSLEKSLVHDGDLLLLRPGRVPPKGFIRPEIWLFPNSQSVQHGSTGFLSWLSDGIQNLMRSGQGETTGGREPIMVGEVEISLEAQLDDLKIQIMTLPSLSDITIPMVDFLRVRTIEEGKLSTVLKGFSQTLSKLRLKSCSRLAIQVLSQEENLTVNHIVLEVKQRIPETKTYSPGQELVWDVSQGATLHDLKQKLADMFLIPVDHLLMAKHFPKKFEWLVIKDQNKKPVQKGGKRKGAAKSNLRQAPYSLHDGDIIGIKNLQFDPLRPEDFNTEEDEAGQEQLKRIADEKKKEREERKNRQGGDFNFEDNKKRKPEVTLTIKVDDFT